jgi:hypothetical protein
MDVEMILLERRLAVQLMVLVIFCCGASYSLADPQSDPKEERITKLEAVVSSLENRISALEGSPAQKQAEQKNINATLSAWKSKSNWRLLSKGMTKEQVKNILGEAENIDASGPFETWYWNHQQGPEVTFYNEKLYGWEEPD